MLPFNKRYTLGKQLGEGATAKVYHIVHNSTGNTYAAKVVSKKKLNSTQLNDLDMEVSTTKHLNHSSIVHLKETKTEGDKVYLVLEEMHGGELFDRIVDQGGFSEKKARELFFNLTSAVAYCHRKGIVHRDLKPENILLKTATKGDEHNLKLADFGIAAHLPKKLIAKSPEEQEKAMPFARLCGSPEYMAPEVIQANKKFKRGYGPKCDIWSLGVVLYVLLCGELPFTLDGGDEEDEDEDEDEMEDENDPNSGGPRNLSPGVRRLFRRICSGKFHMKGKLWSNKISTPAKKLISKMLTVDVLLRPSARQVLCDKWFQGMQMPAADNSVASPSMYPSLLATASEGSLPTEEERMLFLKRREFLLDIGSRFSRATELEVLLKDGVERARGLMHADRGTIFVVDHENSQMWTTVAEGLRGKEIVIPLGAGLVGACYKSGAVINVKDAVK